MVHSGWRRELKHFHPDVPDLLYNRLHSQDAKPNLRHLFQVTKVRTLAFLRKLYLSESNSFEALKSALATNNLYSENRFTSSQPKTV